MDGMRNRVYWKWEIQLIMNKKSYVKTCSAFTPGLHSCCSCSRVAMPCATLLGSTLLRFSHCSSGDVLLSATAVGSLWCDCCCFRVMMLEEFAKILTTCCQHGWHPATVQFWLIWAGFWPQSLHCETKSMNFQIICFYCLENMFSLSKKFICKWHIHSFTKILLRNLILSQKQIFSLCVGIFLTLSEISLHHRDEKLKSCLKNCLKVTF